MQLRAFLPTLGNQQPGVDLKDFQQSNIFFFYLMILCDFTRVALWLYSLGEPQGVI